MQLLVLRQDITPQRFSTEFRFPHFTLSASQDEVRKSWPFGYTPLLSLSRYDPSEAEANLGPHELKVGEERSICLRKPDFLVSTLEFEFCRKTKLKMERKVNGNSENFLRGEGMTMKPASFLLLTLYSKGAVMTSSCHT